MPTAYELTMSGYRFGTPVWIGIFPTLECAEQEAAQRFKNVQIYGNGHIPAWGGYTIRPTQLLPGSPDGCPAPTEAETGNARRTEESPPPLADRDASRECANPGPGRP